MFKRAKKVIVMAMAAAVVCAAAARAGGYAEFPQDPRGVKVIDRASFDVSVIDSGTWHFYAITYNTKTNGIMKIYSIFEKSNADTMPAWKEIYTWKMAFQGKSVKLKSNEVLGIAQNDPAALVVSFWTNTYAGYIEGAAHIGLNYDIKTGKFTQDWSD